MSRRILVVDDEPDITALVANHLTRAGFEVATAASGEEALEAARATRPDVVVLDLMLPGTSGQEVLREFRQRGETRDVGIILVTTRREEADRLRSRSAGADDYLAKPFSPQELLLRITTLLARPRVPRAALSRVVEGPLVVDREARTVTVGGAEVALTDTEWRLLLLLLDRRGVAQTRPQLFESIWEAQPDLQTRAVDMHIQRLRSKLGPTGGLIETVRKFGYRFRAAGS